MMNFNTGFSGKALSIVLGSFTGLVGFASVSTATPASALNPCPGIYYEEPHNSLRIVPQGCPPNAKTRLLNEQGQVPITSSINQVTPIQPPLPETQQMVIATITPQMGRVNVRLRNATNTQVIYQAIGNTPQRMLAGREEIVLQGIPVPATVTFLRPDGGLVKVIAIASAEPGVLVLRLDEATGLNDSQATMRIQSSGQVSAY